MIGVLFSIFNQSVHHQHTIWDFHKLLHQILKPVQVLFNYQVLTNTRKQNRDALNNFPNSCQLMFNTAIFSFVYYYFFFFLWEGVLFWPCLSTWEFGDFLFCCIWTSSIYAGSRLLKELCLSQNSLYFLFWGGQRPVNWKRQHVNQTEDHV